MKTEDVVILAMDELDLSAAMDLVREVGDSVYAFKIHDLYDRFGPSTIQALRDAGASRIWVDVKLHDIPNTVAARARALASAGVDIITVHASGGVEMMEAAKQAGLIVFAVTILTSLHEKVVQSLYGRTSKESVLHLAKLATRAGVDGVVCSPQEVGSLALRSDLGPFKLITPGVRSVGKSKGDQKRVGTPEEALNSGASFIVMGRQITTAADPVVAMHKLAEEIVLL